MRWQGKIIGVFLGLTLGGGRPMVLFVCVLIGHLYDSGFFEQWLGPIGGQFKQTQVQRLFFDATFAIMGYLAKSDGRVSEKEIAAARRVMAYMGLNQSMRQEAINLFNQGKQPDFDWRSQMQRLRQACRLHPSLLRTFLEIQLQLVYAEGTISPAKRQALLQVCAVLGVTEAVFEQFERQSRAEQHYQRSYQRTSTRVDPRQQQADAYQILGVEPSATDAEVTKAYRRLMSKHHPDKLVAKGLPPEMIKLATEKTQKIKRAYDTLKSARGI